MIGVVEVYRPWPTREPCIEQLEAARWPAGGLRHTGVLTGVAEPGRKRGFPPEDGSASAACSRSRRHHPLDAAGCRLKVRTTSGEDTAL